MSKIDKIMATMNNSYGSAKTVTALRQGSFLSAEQLEAIENFFGECNLTGDYLVTLGDDIRLELRFRGYCSKTEVRDGIFAGRAATLADVYWANFIEKLLNEWQGSEAVISYGVLRNEMQQQARGYYSRMRKASNEEKLAMRMIIRKLEDKDVLRKQVLPLFSKKTVATTTFQMLRGQGGKIRIVPIV